VDTLWFSILNYTDFIQLVEVQYTEKDAEHGSRCSGKYNRSGRWCRLVKTIYQLLLAYLVSVKTSVRLNWKGYEEFFGAIMNIWAISLSVPFQRLYLLCITMYSLFFCCPNREYREIWWNLVHIMASMYSSHSHDSMQVSWYGLCV